LDDLGADGKARIKWMLRKWDRGMNWIGLSEERNTLRGVVNAAMNTQVR